MTVKKKVTKKKPKKKTNKILPMVIITGEDGQSYVYKGVCGFLTEEKFKLYDSMLGRKISVQLAKDTKKR